MKNLFFGTARSFLRKGAEATLVPVAELVLGKQRILELYLNVVEWGPGVYGAEAAFSLPLRNRGPQYRASTGSSARCDSARSPEATPRAHEQLQRDHPEAHEPNGLVIAANINE